MNMAKGIENIKRIYGPILNDDHEYKTINNLVDFENYLVETFDELNSKKSTRAFLYGAGIFNGRNTSKKQDDLMIEAIYSNLYCDIVVILQNLNKEHTICHEEFLSQYRYERNEPLVLTDQCIERFRTRMKPNRLKYTDKSRIGEEKICCYYPTISRAYKETLLVKRNGFNIMDISKNFADIFSYLFLDSDEDNSSKSFTKSIEVLKSYRIWEFNKLEMLRIREIYHNIFKDKSDKPFESDLHAEFMLMEKMFGFFNIAKLLKYDSTSDNIIKNTYLLQNLGYTALHEFLFEEIYLNGNNFLEYEIEDHIYPVCYKTLHKLINNIISHIDKDYVSTKEAIDFLNKVKILCKSRITFKPNEGDLIPIDSVTGKRVARIIKVRNGLHRLKSIDDFYSSICRFEKEFSDDYYDSKYKETINFKYFFDKSFTDLTLLYKKKRSNDITDEQFKPLFFDNFIKFLR